MQRDVAQLQQLIKICSGPRIEKLPRPNPGKHGDRSANKANTSVADSGQHDQKNLRDQEDKVVTPVVGLGTRVDEMGERPAHLKPGDGRPERPVEPPIQAQLTDVSNAMKVIQQAPPRAPAAARRSRRRRRPAGQTPRCRRRPCTMRRARTMERQVRSGHAGVWRLSAVLRQHRVAPNAQFYIAMIHFVQQNYETAVKEFDMVLEKYPDTTTRRRMHCFTRAARWSKCRGTRPRAPTNSWK